MTLNRRDFIKSSLAAAAAASFPGVWLRAREASALEACESGVNLVILQLDGGNDGLNTVVPLTNGTGSNRTVYDTKRPWLRILPADLAATQIGNDPLRNGQLALHPHMTAFKSLYDSGNLAVILGTHYNKGNLSHEISKSIFYRADPLLAGPGSGWLGRSIENLCAGQPLAVPAVDASSSLTPLFYGNAGVLAFASLTSLSFPTISQLSSSQKAAFKNRFLAAYQEANNSGANYVATLGAAGYAAISKIDDYKTANQGYAVNLNDLRTGSNGGGLFGIAGANQDFSLARQLRMVLALMKGKQPGDQPLGCRIFRVSIGGFDTHSGQGQHIPLSSKSLAEKVADGFRLEDHGRLLHRVDKAIGAFWQDCIDHNLHRNTVIMTFTEFGRRIAENGDVNQDSGTDHGTASPMFVIGPTAAQSSGPAHLVGGMYGAHPELHLPDSAGNPAFQLDFRHVYGEVMNKWLGVSMPNTNSILGAGGFSYSPQGFLV